jgi:hypothetical protein
MSEAAVHVVPPVFCSRERRSAPGAAPRLAPLLDTSTVSAPTGSAVAQQWAMTCVIPRVGRVGGARGISTGETPVRRPRSPGH